MYMSRLFVAAAIAATATAAPPPPPSLDLLGGPPYPITGVPQHIYDRAVHFLKIAQATYAGDGCHIASVPRIATFLNETTDIYGWLLHDDATRELIVSFRGTNSTVNLDEDLDWTPLSTAGTLPLCIGCTAFGGYYQAYLSIMDQVYAVIAEGRKAYPTYGLVVTGHSLGAGMAALLAAHIAPIAGNLTLWTYGEPRSGNINFAHYLDILFTAATLETTRYHRVTHADDGVAVVPYVSDGYWHQGLELWSPEPTGVGSASTMQICPPENFCVEQLNSTGRINAAHITYFNVSSGTCSPTV